jgi:ligand-binding SRPBCC domain-containing protein
MIDIKRHSGIYTLKVKQNLPLTKNEAWRFLSDPGNLQKITPNHMGFQITSNNVTDSMYPGQIITYKVSPFNGIKMNWVTEITYVKEGEYFVDEQRFGPYKMWHHEHFIQEVNNRVEMTDLVSYKIPFGVLGWLLHKLVIKRKLYQIFKHRFNTLRELYGD